MNFDSGDLGQNTVVLTVEDQSGNTNTGTAIVTVMDDSTATLAFQEVFSDPRGIVSGSLSFNDVDADGNQEFVITGVTNQNQFGFTGGQISRMFEMSPSGNFQEIFGMPFQGYSYASSSFKDINDDGILDFVSTGEDYSTGNNFTHYYTNDGTGTFTEETGLTSFPLNRVDFKYADFDGDNDDDLLLTGINPNSNFPNSRVYENQGTNANPSYVFAGSGIPHVSNSSISVADVDGDMDLDIFVSGIRPSGNLISRLFLNDGNFQFTGLPQATTGFARVESGDSGFADLDDDGDQDLLITGRDANGNNVLELYLNDGLTINDVAQAVGSSVKKVSACINKTLNSNFSEWVNSYRVAEVKQRIDNPDYDYLTIEAIGQESGFRSRSAMYAAFKKFTGESPASLRKS
jgi:AraC-like DNA-binding protein